MRHSLSWGLYISGNVHSIGTKVTHLERFSPLWNRRQTPSLGPTRGPSMRPPLPCCGWVHLHNHKLVERTHTTAKVAICNVGILTNLPINFRLQFMISTTPAGVHKFLRHHFEKKIAGTRKARRAFYHRNYQW
jgi:hypothetical protein